MILRLKNIISRNVDFSKKLKLPCYIKLQQRKLNLKLTINHYALLLTPIIAIIVIVIVIIVTITATVLFSYVWWHPEAAGGLWHWIQTALFRCLKGEERGRSD